MAAKDTSYTKQKLRQGLREFFLNPVIYGYMAILLTLPWWGGAWFYLFIKSLLYVPSGAIAWTTVAVFIPLILCGFANLFLTKMAMRKNALQGVMAKPKVWPFLAASLGLFSLIGPALAITFNHTIQDDVRRTKSGKLVIWKKQDQLRSLVKGIEHQGVFLWMAEDRDEE